MGLVRSGFLSRKGGVLGLWGRVKTKLVSAARDRGRKRVIRRRFNVGVLEAIPKREAWHAF